MKMFVNSNLIIQIIFIIFMITAYCLISTDAYDQNVCTGTNSGVNSGRDNYFKFKAIYTNCVYIDGNLEISNFNPFNSPSEEDDPLNDNKLDSEYDFSFLDTIKEITGYLLIHNTRLKNLRLKNLKLIRGKSLFSNKYSVYIESNFRLERIDLINLAEILRGSVLIVNNPKLCHMDEVNWSDLLSNKSDITLINNADKFTCLKCTKTCSQLSSKSYNSLLNGCWYPNGCQSLSKVTCDKKCTDRCYGPGTNDCCDEQCLGGCTGPSRKECIACKKLRIVETGVCVETCPKIEIVDPMTGELTYNPNGMYQYGISCVRTCPSNLFIYQELCLSKCPNQTYEVEEIINNPETGEKGTRRVCKPCTPDKCPKSCSITKINDKTEFTVKDLKKLENCQVLNSDLLILQPTIDNHNFSNPNIPPELSEKDLEVLSSLKVINGIVRIQSNRIKNLNFLRNLEIIRPNNLVQSLKTLGLKKLRKIETGDVYFYTEQLCLYDTINWNSILNPKNQFLTTTKIKNYSAEYCEKEGYKCDVECNGCWSTGSSSCQYCKTYKLDESCVNQCDGKFINNRYTYLANKENRECKYCHLECQNGCTGPTENECFSCMNYKLFKDDGTFKCVSECPSTHYLNETERICRPCANGCFGCTGPREKIDENGCINCNSALVENDNAFTVSKCIIKEEYNCTDTHYWSIIPQNMHSHSLKGKLVCIKCNEECDGCFSNGVKLAQNCKKCKNFYSNSTKECVNNCSGHNEYLQKGTKTCLPCNKECKFGCTDNSIYECNECKSFKIYLNDIRKLVDKLIKKNVDVHKFALKTYISDEYKQIELSSILIDNLNENDENLNEILKNYRNYYIKKISNNQTNEHQMDETNLIFCINECPVEMPFQNTNLFCTNEKLIEDSNFKSIFVIFSLIAILILVTSLVISCTTFKYINDKNRKKIKLEKEFFNSINDNDYKDYNDDVKEKPKLTLIKDSELEKIKELGQGAFGIVYEGYYKLNGNNKDRIKVAIKELNICSTMSEEKVKESENEILKEAIVMASVNHKYCLQLSGLCVAQSIKMVFELMKFGSAVSFLQKYRESVTEKMLLVWSQQIAEGMDYLESKGIVHRDLAARNILIKSLDHIKITDYGLARILDSNKKAFYAESKTLLPIKWLAIESILERKFTHKSDVWSYGVCIWELFTFCAKPYAEIETINIINYLKKGVRLAQPQMAHLITYEILLKCWFEKPSSRPSFKELSDEFSKMALDPKRFLSIKNIDQNIKFLTINENSICLNETDEDDSDHLVYGSANFDLNNETKRNANKSKYVISRANSNLLPDEGIDLVSYVPTSCALNTNQTELNYDNSIVVFKRESNQTMSYETTGVVQSNKTKKNPSPIIKNMSFIRKLLQNTNNKPKRLNSQVSNTTTSTSYLSSAYSSASVETNSPRQIDFINYEEQQGLLNSSSSHTPSRSNSRNSSSNNNSMDYFTNRVKDTTNINSDYVEPVTHNIKQNLEYFDGNQTSSRLLTSFKVTDEKLNTKKSVYYNDDLINYLERKNFKEEDV